MELSFKELNLIKQIQQSLNKMASSCGLTISILPQTCLQAVKYLWLSSCQTDSKPLPKLSSIPTSTSATTSTNFNWSVLTCCAFGDVVKIIFSSIGWKGSIESFKLNLRSACGMRNVFHPELVKFPASLALELGCGPWLVQNGLRVCAFPNSPDYPSCFFWSLAQVCWVFFLFTVFPKGWAGSLPIKSSSSHI